MKKKLLFILLLFSSYSFSQWVVPNPMEQFCAGGSTLTFPNVGNGHGAGDMGSLGCLSSTPNPSWYFMQIANSGDLTFNISQITDTGSPIDVDFALWGPFNSIDNAITSIQQNPENNTLIGCSYSPAPQETAMILNAQAGEIYVFLITNYDGQSGQISLTQISGVGSTSCDFACGVSLGADTIVSCHNSHTLEAVFNTDFPDLTGVTYQWSHNGNPLPDTTSILTVTQDGEYTVTALLANCTEPAVASVQITLNQDTPLVQINGMEGCATDYFSFLDITNQLIQQYPDDKFNVGYFESFENAETNQNPLPLSYQSGESQTIYVRVTNKQFTDCFSITSFYLTVHQQPEITSINDLYSICNGEPITITAVGNFDSYQWSDGSTDPVFNVTQSGNYSVTVTKNNCSATKTFSVTESEKATILDVIISDFTMNQNSIEVIVQGIGDYEYSINGINYQDSPVFTNVDSGTYMVYINDKNGCDIVNKKVDVLMYPKFFTPNKDGINDYWQIKYAFTEPGMKTYIFDRYGKLVYSFRGKDIGWDGTLNGNELPSSDYWFLITRENGKEHRGHFSLVR